MDLGGQRLGGTCLWACVCASVAAAGAAFVITTTAAVAQQSSVTAAASFPTLDRRTQVAPSAEFAHLKALAHDAGHVRVIVGLRVAFTPEGALSSAAQDAQHRAIAGASAAVRRALTGTDHRVTRTYDLLPLIALDLSEDAVSRLKDTGLAATLWEDTPRPPSAVVEGARAPVLMRDQAGVAIALLDTGVDRAHLRTAKVVSEACFSANGNCPNGTTQQVGAGAGRPCAYASRECQHGTQVAGIAAAPTATDIIAIQVFSRFTGGDCKYEAEKPCVRSFESDHVAGLEHILHLRDRFKIGATTISLGSGLSTLGCDENPLKLAIDNLRSVGIPTLIASATGGFRNAADMPRCISIATSEDAAAANLKPAATVALPDLAISTAAIDQDSPRRNATFAMRGVTTTFSWDHVTKNIPMEGKPTKPANPSVTAAGFLVGTKLVVEDTLPVAKLLPGKQQGGLGDFSENFGVFDFGNYPRQVCANAGTPKIKERPDDEVDCKFAGPFSVIPAHIRGEIEGSITVPSSGATFAWKGTVDFVFKQRTRNDVYSYSLTPNTKIKFTVSGDSGIVDEHGKHCFWTGGKTYRTRASDDDKILLSVEDPGYRFLNQIRNGFSMTYSLDCLDLEFPFIMSGMPWMRSPALVDLPQYGPWHLEADFKDDPAVYSWNLDAFDETGTPDIHSANPDKLPD